MLIDKTFFEGLLLIPNLSEPEPNGRTESDLAHMIEVCEEEVLSFAFGIEMWEDFKANHLANPMYQKIINGASYVKNDKKCYWKGLIQTEPIKRSLLADYVYSQWHSRNVTKTTELGEKAMDTKIGERASSTPKIVNAWNSFIEQLQGGRFLYGANGYTTEGNPYWVVENRLGTGYGISYYGGNIRNGNVSLLEYLMDNKEDYPLFDDERRAFGYEYKNSFGI